jgi:hypothetical protein
VAEMREPPLPRKHTEPSSAGQRKVPAFPIVVASTRVSLFRTYKSNRAEELPRMRNHTPSIIVHKLRSNPCSFSPRTRLQSED